MYEELILNLDGSYTFKKNGMLYNCPNFDEWVEEFAQVDAWAKEHPEQVQHEQPLPPPTLDDLKKLKKEEIASARYEYEISGITFHDVHITTDREDQAMITATALSAVLDPTATTVWKGANGYLTLKASEILEMARAVADHVESAFIEEKRLVELIDSATTEEELSSITWTL